MHTPKKSTNMSSATGRSPVAAAPTAAPMNPDSEIGVSSTRSRPYFLTRPLVTPRTPPQASSSSNPGTVAPPATSSPIRITDGSRAISWSRLSLIASRKVSVLTATAISQDSSIFSAIGDVDVGQGILGRGQRARLGERDGRVHLRIRLPVDALDIRRRQKPAVHRLSREHRQRVVLAVRRRLLGGPVGDLVALEMAEVAPGLGLDQAWAVAP